MRDRRPPEPDHVHSTQGGPGIFTVSTRARSTTTTTSSSSAPARAGSPRRSGTGTGSAPDSKILLIDSLPDFGGHSHRNEFHIPDAANGGARRDDPAQRRDGEPGQHRRRGTSRRAASSTSRAPTASRPSTCSAICGVDPDNFPSSSRARASRARTACRQMLLFPSEDWGTGLPSCARSRAARRWPEFLATTPYSPEAQAGIATIMTDDTTDWISIKDGPKTDQEKKAILARITYKKYLMRLRRRERGGDRLPAAHVARAVRAPASSARRRATRGRSATRASTASASTTTSSPASAGPPSRTRCRQRPDAGVAGRQHVAAAAARQQADPERDRRRRRRAPDAGQHPRRQGRLHPARPPGQRRPDPAQQHRRRRPGRAREGQARRPRQVAEQGLATITYVAGDG